MDLHLAVDKPGLRQDRDQAADAPSVRGLPGDTQIGQRVRQMQAERGAAEGAGENPDQGDPGLHGGGERSRVVEQARCRDRRPAAPAGHGASTSVPA